MQTPVLTNQSNIQATLPAIQRVLEEMENNDVQLRVRKIEADDSAMPNEDIPKQKLVKQQLGIWSIPIRASMDLIDKSTGEIVSSVENMKIADIPKMTDRNTYIVKGNEYQFTKQLRLKPGVYTQRQSNGDISSFINADKTIDFDRGFNRDFKINFDPETKLFKVNYGNRTIPLISALRMTGKTDDEIKSQWGDAVFKANNVRYKNPEQDAGTMYFALFGKSPDAGMGYNEVKEIITERLKTTKLDPEVTKETLGKPFDHVNSDVLAITSKKIIDINTGDVAPDDRESLAFKSIHDSDTLMKDNLLKNGKKIASSTLHKLQKTRNIRSAISPQTFNPHTAGTITTSKLSNPPTQQNPLSILGEGTKITLTGEGGIGSSQAITTHMRQISNTEMGYIDPMHTPEGGGIGIANHLSSMAYKEGNDIVAMHLDPEGNKVKLTAKDRFDKYVAFPDQYSIKSGEKPKPKNKKIRAIYKNDIVEVEPSKIDYIFPFAQGVFDSSVNMIPFLDSIQANRGLTASKMQEQAVSLKNREVPLFDIVSEKGNSIQDKTMQMIGIPKSPVDGEIQDISEDKITIKDNDGKIHDVYLYNNFSLNSESYLHNDPVVKVGDKVTQKQVLADNNFTKDGGHYALGANLDVAYIPWKGYNFEDSAVISESAAKKFTSQHMYDVKDRRTSSGVFSRAKFKAYFPEVLKAKNEKKLDADGVIRVGETVEPGEVVVAHLEKRMPTADDIAVGRLDKQLKRDMGDNSQVWDKHVRGVVTGVEKKGNHVVVNIKTEEPMKEADKIVGLHGNKHIISKILPDSEMPFNPRTGRNIDLTMSPIGVMNRINSSQILENAAGKIAEARGERYKIKNFSDEDSARKIMEELKELGLEDKETLIDPETGKEIVKKIQVGKSHILKLEHKVDHKFSARYRDGHDAYEQAASGGVEGGKNLGRMELGSLLARGAYTNLREMFDIKGQKNDEWWRALETGQTPPPLKNAYVWDKMISDLKGAGINVEQNGKQLLLNPMTDKNVETISAGALTRPTETYRKKNFEPIKGGLFDPERTGGMQGTRWTHIDLPEKTLNPITANAAAALAGVSRGILDDVIHGKKFVDEKTREIVAPGSHGAISGGKAVELLLSNIDLEQLKAKTEGVVKISNNPTDLNKAHKTLRYIKALNDSNMKPTDYLISKVPVTPPKYRPMFQMGGGETIVISDENELYQSIAQTSNAMSELKQVLDESQMGDDVNNIELAGVRGQIYDELKALQGLGDPTSFMLKMKNKKGFIRQMDGDDKQTKYGFIQRKVMQRRQDLIGRSTVTLDPNMDSDHIGLPKEMANKIFQPFIIQKLVGMGYSPIEAKKEVEKDSEAFRKARQIVADERVVIANRAPSLHKYNMLALKPILTDKKSIDVSGNIIAGNLGGDFDGDSALTSTMILLKKSSFCEISTEIPCSFGGDMVYYSKNDIDSFTVTKEVSMPTLEKLPVFMDDGDKIIHIHLEDFPRLQHTRVIKENGNEEFDVPSGIEIITVDNKTHKVLTVPVTKFSIHKNLENYIVTCNNKETLVLSSDQSAIAVNPDTWELERVAPSDLSDKRMMAKVLNTDINSSLNSIPLVNVGGQGSMLCKDKMPLTRDTGWLIGAIIGDGWVSDSSRTKTVCLASIIPVIGEKFSSVINSLLESDIACTVQHAPHEFQGFDCNSTKYIKSSINLAHNFSTMIGQKAKNKHLPDFYMAANEGFKLGLIEGLMDTDGLCQFTKAESKGKKTFTMQYSTISIRLAEELVTLLRAVGIKSSLKAYKYSQGRKGVEYKVIISTASVIDKDLKLIHPDKLSAYQEFCSTGYKDSQSIVARQDLVPVSKGIIDTMLQLAKYKVNISEYNAISDSKKTGCKYMTRVAAEKIIGLDINNALDSRWVEIVKNKSITWVYAKTVKLNPERIDMYDITAPGPYTFMATNGIIVQDTLQLHTPITEKAVKEALEWLPSKNMLKTGYDTVLNAPAKDTIAGTWLASKGVDGKDVSDISTMDQLKKAYQRGDIQLSDNITINGRTDRAIMHLANEGLVPEDQKWGVELNANRVNSWIRDVASKRIGSKDALNLADRLRSLGDKHTSRYGFTFGVSDSVVDKDIRDKYLKEAKKEAKTGDVIEVYSKTMDKIKKELLSKHQYDDIGIAVHSGAAKNIDNPSQIISMPGLLMDSEDRPIPIPVTRSYSEGLPISDYWTSTHGARGGSIKKSVQSFAPGYMTKDLVSSMYQTRIESDSPLDEEGLNYKTNDIKAIKDRFLAKDVRDDNGKIVAKRNELINDDMVNRFNQHNIKSINVQSPLTDPTPGDGFSSYSYGLDNNHKMPKRGDNIGVISAHTITEPSLNLAMKSFHTGGAFTGMKKRFDLGTAFDALDRTLRFTKKLPDKATLASMDGTVEGIDKSPGGGYDVTVSNNGAKEVYYVGHRNEPIVTIGQQVKKGEVISEGTPDPHEYLDLNGMKKTQRFLVEKLSDINEGKLDKRDIETIVRGITNTTKIDDPGDSNFTFGDNVPLTTVEWFNKNMKDKKPIQHTPKLVSLGIGGKSGASEDWLGRLAHSRLKEVFMEGTTQRWMTDVMNNTGNPLPDLIVTNKDRMVE